MVTRPTTVLSLFSGIGALDLAIARAFPGIRPVAYVEGEAYAAAVLVARMESGDLDPAPVWSDVRTFPGDALRGRVDLVCGGFPCQDISLAGKGEGLDGERSGLFFDLMRVVRDVRPRYVYLENVAALTVRGVDAVLGALAESGFDAEWGCLRASDVGAPHRRDRWWCLAWDRELVNAEGIGRTDGAGVADSGRPLGSPEPGADGRVVAGGAAPRVRERGGVDPAGQEDLRQLAHGDGAGLHEHGQQNGRALSSGLAAPRRHDTGGCHQAVEHTPLNGRREGWPEPAVRRGRDAAAGPDGAVGNTRCCRVDGRAPEPGRGPILGAAAAGTGEGVGDAECLGGERRRDADDVACACGDPEGEAPERERGGGAHRHPGARMVPFPPGPDDRDSWRAYLEQYPDLAPAIERAVRGSPHESADGLDVCLCPRVDRLRSLGNAVVPAQCEAALRLLWWRAFGEVLP